MVITNCRIGTSGRTWSTRFAAPALILLPTQLGHACATAIQEQNSVPGFTNRVLGKLVRRVFIAFDEAARFLPSRKVEHLGNPVRKAIVSALEGVAAPTSSGGKLRILVVGGSQGARAVSELVMARRELVMVAAPMLIGKGVDFSLVHQTGNSAPGARDAPPRRGGTMRGHLHQLVLAHVPLVQSSRSTPTPKTASRASPSSEYTPFRHSSTVGEPVVQSSGHAMEIGAVTTLAGLPPRPGIADGVGGTARFFHPAELARSILDNSADPQSTVAMGIHLMPGGLLGLALLAVGSSAEQGASADPAPLESDAPKDGVFFGARLGPGFLYASFDDQNTSGQARIWGQSSFVGLWAGFSIAPRLILSAEFNQVHAFWPSSGFDSGMDRLDLSAVGPGLKYYLASDSIYLATAPLLSRLSFQGGGYLGNRGQRSHWGLTVRLAAGKEWQTSPSWRVGLEGAALLGWMDYDPEGPDVIVAVKGASLSVSLAYDGHQKRAHESDLRRRIYADARLGVGMLRWRNADTALYWRDRGIGRTASAVTIPMAVAIGWALTPRLILLGELVHGRHRRIETDAPGSLEGVYSYGLGPGLRYYLNETSLFVEGSLSWFKIDQTGWGNYGGSLVQHGVAARLSLGREIWLSPNWALGVAVEVMSARMHAEDLGSYFATGAEILSSLTYGPAPASGRPPEPVSPVSQPRAPGEHTHDGLYVGVRAGVGWIRSPAFRHRDGGVLKGRDWQLALAVGTAITRHVILFGELAESQVRSSDGSGPVDFSLVVAGPGVTYYLEPSNFFFSGALGWSGFGSTRYTVSHSGSGVTGRLSVGKEWWISSNWGVGLAAEALLGNLAEGSVSGASLQAVASFN